MTLHHLKTGKVTDLRTRASYQPDCAALARNRIATARLASGKSHDEFARVLSEMTGRKILGGHVASWETSVTPPGDVLIAAETVSATSATRIGVRSHKFIAGYIGPEAAAALSRRLEMCPVVGDMFGWHSTDVDHPSGRCALHVWPFGSVIFHLAEDLEVPSIATLALWRVRSYTENLEWASRKLNELAGGGSASYVLSAYWVHTPIWAGRILPTALRLICCPRVLLDRETEEVPGSAENSAEVESALLAEEYEHSGMRAFGMRGISTGYASWSGVAYYPIDTKKALMESEIIAFELAIQSVWVYCEHLTEQVERGYEPMPADGYGWRFLRAARSRLANPRPQEPGQHQAMRGAILQTSLLPELLSQALEALKEKGKL